MAELSTEQEWLNAYENYASELNASQTSKYIYEQLMNSNGFRVEYLRTRLQQIVVFILPQSGRELIRIVIHTGQDVGKKKGTWVTKDHHAPWDAIWISEFKSEFGYEPMMGQQIIDWCLEKIDNKDRLANWLIRKASEYAG